MITEDVQLPSDGSWMAIDVGSIGEAMLYNGYNRECMLKFGDTSESVGMIIESEQVVKVAEMVYVRLRSPRNEKLTGSLQVTR